MSLLLAVVVSVEGQAAGLLIVTIASEHQLDAWRTLGLPGGRCNVQCREGFVPASGDDIPVLFLLLPWCFTSTGTVWVIRNGGSIYFSVFIYCYRCQYLGFLPFAQTLMHAIAHGGCSDTVRGSALIVDWEKNPVPECGLDPASLLRLAVRSDSLPTELPRPLEVDREGMPGPVDHCQ